MNLARFGSIYVLTNSVTGGQYVGQTVNTVALRFYAHTIAAQKPKFKINYAIAEFGAAAFSVVEVYVAFDKAALDAAERAFIFELQPEYNMTSGGAGMPGVETPTSVRAKRSEAARARWQNLEWRVKTVASIKAASQTEAAKARGRAMAKFEGSKIRWRGHVKREIPVKQSRAEATASSWADPAARQRRLAAHRAAVTTPEHRRKMAQVAFARGLHTAALLEEMREKRWQGKTTRVYCPEVQITFLSSAYAAEFFNVVPSTISNALTSGAKIGRKHGLKYTVMRVHP
jgi:group I intron endonuclease